MTTIAPFAAGSYATNRNTSQLVSLKSQLNDLTTQLSSGLTAQTYGGLGSGRSTALSAQASISTLNGYATVIGTAQTRAKLATTSMSQVVTVGTATNTTLQNGLQSTSTDTQAAKSTALNNLNAALDALNQSDGSVYLFGGKDGSVQPVLDANAILNGTTDKTGTALDGLSTIVAEQVAADVGSGGTGRLSQTNTGSSITLTEDASARAVLPQGAFGFQIADVESSNQTALTKTQTSSVSPVSYTLNVAALPQKGDTLTVQLGLPDGSKTTIKLTAATSSDPSSDTTFVIGSDVNTTAANISNALSALIKTSAATTLSANATARASSDFFSASVQGQTSPQRVYYDAITGEPSYVHTSNSTTPVKHSVVWYQGENGTDDTARDSQIFQIGSSATVQLGARANEASIQKTLAGLATVALGMPANSATGTRGAYEAVVAAATPLLSYTATTSPSVQDIVTDFSLASARMTNAASNNTAQQSTLQDTVDGIEQASTEEVAIKLMDLQTRLQASYQITSSLSKLSLVNYMS